MSDHSPALWERPQFILKNVPGSDVGYCRRLVPAEVGGIP